MLIFNFSEMAAKHIYPSYKKGRNTGIFEIPLHLRIEEEVKEIEKSSRDQLQFFVYAFEIGSDYHFVVMEYHTRWCHVLHKMKKADLSDFVQRFYERWISSIAWMGDFYGLFSQSEMRGGIKDYFLCHDEIKFHIRTDASCNTHMSQIAHDYEYTYRIAGEYPKDEKIALSNDLGINSNIRKKKGNKNYFRPKAEMMALYLSDYLHWTDKKIQTAKQIMIDEDTKTFNGEFAKPTFSVDTLSHRTLH